MGGDGAEDDAVFFVDAVGECFAEDAGLFEGGSGALEGGVYGCVGWLDEGCVFILG